jgi:hypothetical protein
MEGISMTLATTLAIGVALFSTIALAADDHAVGGKGTLYHVVSLKFKESATKEQIAAVDDAFVALKEKVPGVLTLTWGDNVSPENHAKGFTQCFVLTFASETDRDAYLVHPEHKAFGKLLGPIMADVFVIDFRGR